jgi:acyl dehydratase
MAINYGLNRVRFPSAVLAGAGIRARIVLQSMRDVGDATEVIYLITIESQRAEKPCCVAEWVVRYYQ